MARRKRGGYPRDTARPAFLDASLGVKRNTLEPRQDPMLKIRLEKLRRREPDKPVDVDRVFQTLVAGGYVDLDDNGNLVYGWARALASGVITYREAEAFLDSREEGGTVETGF